MTHTHADAFSFEQYVVNIKCCYVLDCIYKTRLEKSESSQSPLPGLTKVQSCFEESTSLRIGGQHESKGKHILMGKLVC